MKRRRTIFWYTAPPIFLLWAVMIGWLVLKERASAEQLGSSSAILQFQPSQAIQWFVVKKGEEQVGYTMRRIAEEDHGGTVSYLLTESRALAVEVNGFFARTRVDMQVTTDDHFRLESFRADASINAERFHAEGERVDEAIRVRVQRGDEPSVERSIPAKEATYLPVSFEPFLAAQPLVPGKRFVLSSLDPLTLASQQSELEVLGRQTITVLGKPVQTVAVRATLQGISSTLYLTATGERVREEAGDFLEERSDRETVIVLRERLFHSSFSQ